MKNKIIAGLSVLALVIGGYLFLISRETPQDVNAGTTVRRESLIGTGTSTAGTFNFSTTAATTTATINVGPQSDIIDIAIFPESASSTSHLTLEVFKSSNPRCAVSGAVGAGDFTDAIATSLTGAGTTTINPATSTISWAVPTQGKSFRLTNFNGDCLRVYVGGKQVNVYIRAIVKTLSF